MNKHSLDSFLDACEATGPLQLELEHADGAAQPLLIHQPFAFIGRHPRADVHLDDPQVSRRHAYLQILGGFVYCIDLHSRSGVHWEEGSEPRSDWFGTGQVVRIGPYRVRLIKGSREGRPEGADLLTPLESGDRGAAAPPEVALEFVNAKTALPPWSMNRPLVLLGAAPECKVRMRDLQVSRFHCSLVNTRKGLWAVDLCGRGGIAVNGVALRIARLDDGDQLQVGEITIRVRCQQLPHDGGDAPAPSAAQGEATAGVSVEAPAQAAGLPGDAWGGQLTSQASRPLPFAPLAALTSLMNLPAVNSAANLPALNLPAEGETALVRAGQQLPVQRDVGEQLLTTVINQFGMMQQQMFDQFQQTVGMMVQMFSGLHRDQMGLLRQELDRVQELTQELTILQAELARLPAGPTGARPMVAAAKPETQARRLAHTPTPPAAPSPAAGAPARTPLPTSSATETGNGAGAAKVAAAAPPAAPPENVHGWLHERIAAIQQERQTRWQKIRDFLLSKPST